jgi:hypothetical protein
LTESVILPTFECELEKDCVEVVIWGSFVLSDRNLSWEKALDCVMRRLLMEVVLRSCSEYLLKCEDAVFFRSYEVR